MQTFCQFSVSSKESTKYQILNTNPGSLELVMVSTLEYFIFKYNFYLKKKILELAMVGLNGLFSVEGSCGM